MDQGKCRTIATFALAVCAVALIAAGIAAGQPADVLRKAATVCLECIGIG